MSKLLIEEKPLVILPKLAKEIGLNEAIVLQQVHYWLLQKHNARDGYYWVYNSYQEWIEKDFVFWSHSTMKRIVKNLEDMGLLVSAGGIYNDRKGNKKKWYRIDYNKLNEITAKIDFFDGTVKPGDSGQNEPIKNESTDQNEFYTGQVEPIAQVNMTQPLTEITSKISKNINNTRKTKVCDIEYLEDSQEYKLTKFFIDMMIKKTGGIFKTPTSLKKWHNEMRLLLDSTLKDVSDDRLERCKKAQELIIFTVNDDFWHQNILSIPKLRKQATQLLIKMNAKNNSYSNNTTTQAQTVQQYNPVDAASLFNGGEWE